MLRPHVFIVLLAIASFCAAYGPSIPRHPSTPRKVDPEHLIHRDDPPYTTTSTTASTTTTSSAIPTKTIAGCNVQGTAAADLTSHYWGSTAAVNSTACQLSCIYVSQCISYSWEPAAGACTWYHQWMDGLVVASNNSGIYYSDKYPSDGTNFCFGDHQL
ncbi:hypothetical protein CJF30_00008629 [Rutstroemia sp. NJR-2017a BBW]|nr:hypothetical protein CJF30_00008629 [Rutstroemia sp. NJR-2017a BBW]